MKQKHGLVLFLTFAFTSAFAQVPSWSVKESDYQYTMTFVAKLNVNGKQLVNTDDRVAAFVGTSCRGVSGLTYVESNRNFYAYLTVFSNTQNENVTFKLYDSATNTVTDVSKEIVFKVNEHRGDLFQSFSIAEPPLNAESKILTFGFEGVQSVSNSIIEGAVNITLFDSYDITKLKPVFTLSKGGKLFKSRVAKLSGSFTEDFTAPIVYEVLSEDESSLSTYQVTVSQAKTPTLFYKKDAVCYAGGAIKVVSNQEGALVEITNNGILKFTQKVTNGQVLFDNLESDTYFVTIGDEYKIINILLKTK
ncbi:MAG: hypothetical protein RLZZ241_622 [Bacteroidota bacterium]